jgi:uncharacterized protein involved in exopolysaccharide biosynthesis
MQSIDPKARVQVESEYEVATSGAPSLHLRNERGLVRLRLLWDHRRFLGRAVLLGLVLSVILAFIIPTRYQSTARLMPPDNRPANAMAAIASLAPESAGGLGGLVGDLVGAKTTSATFVGILESRTAADRLISEFNLQKVYSERRMEDARKKLHSRTYISEDRKSGIITITVTDHDPKRATAMAQAYVTELDHLVAQLATSAARREREFLETRLQVVKRELEQSEIEFSQFASKNTTLDIKEQGKAMLEAAATVQAQVIATETELQGMRQIYTDSNVRVRAAQARLAELKKKLNQLGGQGGRNQTEASGPSSDFQYPSIRQLPVLGVTYADLYRRTRISEIVYELLTRQYELAKVDEAKEIPTVKELDVPVVPQKRSFPPRGLIIFLGTLLVPGLAAAWILTKRFWEEMGTNDPRKQLASEIFQSIQGLLGSLKARRVRRVRVDLDSDLDE